MTAQNTLFSEKYTLFEIRNPKTSEENSETMAALIQSLPQVNNSIWDSFLGKSEGLVFEYVVWHQRVYFMIAVGKKIANYFQAQLTAQYPQASINVVADYFPYFFQNQQQLSQRLKLSSFAQIGLTEPYYYPLKTYQDFRNVDPLGAILGALSKTPPDQKAVVQLILTKASKGWQKYGSKIAQTPLPTADPNRTMPHPQKRLIEQKVSQIGFRLGIKVLINGKDKTARDASVENIANAFTSVSHGEGNKLAIKRPLFWQKTALFNSILQRTPEFVPKNHIFTVDEIATLYHLPNKDLSQIKNLAWGGTLKGEPPENLPISTTPEANKEINFFAKTEFKNRNAVFGIKRPDRRKHTYIIGKTGVGKSTLIANMAINDMRNGEGVAIIDPHGDLCDIVLDYIPKSRLNDVVYLDPNDTESPFRLNPLEVYDSAQADLVASGILSIFHKLYAYSWGPRLEYILRNTLLTLAYSPDTTMLDVVKILTNSDYRSRIVDKLQDQTLVSFWRNQFEKMDSRQKIEAISPILNKVGQFITSPKLRLILERSRSSINIEQIMNSGKILLLNLSQGKIGEDNAALLGSMFITKIQLAAMNRVSVAESERRDFFLYVDEFQNFATTSFAKILSEARKYRLNLTVANQYIGQIPEEIQKAIFGNVGTLISFLIGARDANLVNKEFGQLYEESDLVGLDNYEIITKLSIDNRTSQPFSAKTLPLPISKNQNRHKAIRISREQYGKPDKKQKEPTVDIPQEIPNINNELNPQMPYDHLDNGVDEVKFLKKEQPIRDNKQNNTSKPKPQKKFETNNYSEQTFTSRKPIARNNQPKNKQSYKPKYPNKEQKKRRLEAERAIQRLAGLEQQPQPYPYNTKNNSQEGSSLAERIKQNKTNGLNNFDRNNNQNRQKRTQRPNPPKPRRQPPKKNRNPYVVVAED